MKCDSCQERVATVHLTEIVNKKKKELHLCEECAREKGISVKAQLLPQAEQPEAPAAPAPALGPHPIAKAPAGALSRVDEPSLSCPVCGLTFQEFRASGRLGCANDYQAFKKGLVPLLEKIHGHVVEHKGKVPANVGARLERQKKIAALRVQLHLAIQSEEYEKAAQLRDEILSLEGRAGSAGGRS